MKLGKHWLKHVAPSDEPASTISVMNEIPSGSCCKYKLDKATGQLKLARMLPSGLAYPANYGFAPHTRSPADGEESDTLVLSRVPILPLTIIDIRLIGGYEEHSEDEPAPDERFFGVFAEDPSFANIHSIGEVGDELKKEIEKFVLTHKQDQNIRVTFGGWFDRDAAIERYQKALKRAQRKQPN